MIKEVIVDIKVRVPISHADSDAIEKLIEDKGMEWVMVEVRENVKECIEEAFPSKDCTTEADVTLVRNEGE